MIRFLAYSVLLHFLILFALGQYGAFRHGLDGGKPDMASVRTVFATITPVSGESTISTPDHTAVPKNDRERLSGVFPQSGLSPANADGEGREIFMKGRIKGELDEGNKSGENDNPGQRYFVAGKLTRLPVPLMPVDLNVPSITQRAPGRPIEITLLIDANGAVTNIIRSNRDEDAGEFFELVATQFKKVRFLPGEIDGKRVNAQLTIAVISEPT